MSTQLSTKLAALALALSVNLVMIGGVAVLFSANARVSQVQALAAAPSQSLHGPARSAV